MNKRCRMSPVTPVNVDRTTLFLGTYVPERDSMENANVWSAVIVAAVITVVLVALAVMAAKAAEKGTHGCDLPVVEEESPWGLGVCRSCKKSTEVYLPGSEYSQCGQCMWFGPQPEEDFDPQMEETAVLEQEYQSMRTKVEKFSKENHELRVEIERLKSHLPPEPDDYGPGY